MAPATIETVTKMLESLPDPVQERAVEHLRQYLEDISDELRWDESFAKTSDKLEEAAQLAREQFLSGKTEPFDLERL